MTFKHCVYVGNLEQFKGHTALVQQTTDPDNVLVQFDDTSHHFAYGWHEFQSSEWEETQHETTL